MLQALIDCLVEGVCVINTETYEIEYINEVARHILGINEDDRVGRCFGYFGNGESPCASCNSQMLNRLKGFKAEEYYNSKDGIRYKLNTEDIQQGGKKYRAVFFVEEKEDKENIKISKVKNASISELDALKMPYWEYDMQTHRCTLSDELMRITGLERVSGMHPEEIRDELFASRAEADKLRKLYIRILNGEDSAEEICQTNFNGYRKWVNIMLAVSKDETGKRTHAVGIIKDIDAQKKIIDAFDMAITQNEFKFMSYDLITGEFDTYEAGGKLTVNVSDSNVIDYGLNKFHPDDRKMAFGVIEKARNGVKEQECILRRRHNENEIYKTFKIKITTGFDTSGKAEKIYISRKDITEEEKNRKLYESQLNYLENYRKKSLCYVQVDIYKNKIIDIKSRYSRFRKDSDSGSLDQYISALLTYMPGESGEEFIKALSPKKVQADYESGMTKFDVEVPFELTDEKTIIAHFTMDLLKNPATNELEGYIIVHDNTEDTLIQQIGRTITMMDYDAMGVLDTKTGRVKTIYNQPKDETTFIAKEELDYTENIAFFMPFIPAKNKDSVRRKVSLDYVLKSVKNKGKYKVNITAVTAFGTQRRIQMSYIPINKFPNMLLMGVRDVSEIYAEEKKKRDILKKALAEAKAGENAKIDFLSRMSHDLRTPLNGILGMAQIALDESNEAEIQEYQRKIISSGQMLLSLVNDILDISQAEEKKFILHPEVYSVREFLESINNIIGEQCKNKGVIYTTDFGQIADRAFMVDRLRFGQIFLNLLSNSCKYTREGGKVDFMATVLSEKDGITTVEFRVKDTGIGMSEEFLAHAFDAFSQAHTSTIDTRQGSGLGLSIVKQLVDLLKGNIDIKSKKGHGTEVTVILDLKECEDTAVKKELTEKVKSSDFTGRRALVVEDQPLNAKILIKLLSNKGIYADFAEDGRKAVDTYLESKEGYYDIILMDIRMPVLDGIAATKEIRKHKERMDYNLPIIATTANAFVEDKEKCIAAGMNDHLAKPINSKELYKILMEQLA